MKQYLTELAALVFGAFIGSLATIILAAEGFDAFAFDWIVALKASVSVAILALAKGLIGRFRGDKATVSWRA